MYVFVTFNFTTYVIGHFFFFLHEVSMNIEYGHDKSQTSVYSKNQPITIRHMYYLLSVVYYVLISGG